MVRKECAARPSGAKARFFVALCGTAEAVPYLFLLQRSSDALLYGAEPRYHTSFSATGF